MKKINSIFYKTLGAYILIFALSSCQEVIEIELKDAERKYVIEGAVYEGVDSVTVFVTKTTSYFDTTPPEGVSDATVDLIMPDLTEIPLTYFNNGEYRAYGITVSNEATYQLRVRIDDKTYTASSYMEASLPLDSLEYEFQEGFFGGDDGYTVFLNFQDNPGKNYYRMKYFRNGKWMNEPQDLQIVDDNLNDGNYIRIPIFSRTFDAGDTITAELQSMDAELFKFYQTFAASASEDAGSPFAAAPANPETNITGGALGVFGAYTQSIKTIIIPE